MKLPEMTWHDMTWHDMTWNDMKWHDRTQHNMAWHMIYDLGKVSIKKIINFMEFSKLAGPPPPAPLFWKVINNDSLFWPLMPQN